MQKKLSYDVDEIISVFDLQIGTNCSHLNNWISATYTLSEFEQQQLNDLFEEIGDLVDYMNEEELKIRFVGSLFRIAKVDVKAKLRLFYERPLSAELKGYPLSVICDCMVATPKGYNTPQNPYFFLQEAPSRPSSSKGVPWTKGKESFYKVKKKIPKVKC